MSAVLRAPTPLDLPSILAIEVESFPVPWTYDMFEAELAKSVGLNRVLEESARVIGYSFNHCVAAELHILTLAIHPACRERGYGRSMLLGVLAEARSAGVERAFLEVRVSNKSAREMYEKIGFAVCGSRAKYYSENNEDAVLYELGLSVFDESSQV